MLDAELRSLIDPGLDQQWVRTLASLDSDRFVVISLLIKT